MSIKFKIHSKEDTLDWYFGKNSLWCKSLGRIFGCYKRPVEPVEPPEYVNVLVCSMSGLLPNEYCLDRTRREFEKGKEPTATCALHVAPPPPPPPPPTTQDILRERGYLIGASCYQLITYPLDVIENHFKALQAAGATTTEAFVIFTWAKGWQFQCHKIIGYDYDRDEATGQPVAAYGDYKFPQWDLESWNPDIQAKWRAVFALAKKYRLTLILRLHDFCSLKDPFEKRHYPFSGGKRNLQHKQGKYDSGMWAWDSAGNPHGFDESRKIGPYYRAFLKMFIPMVQESGCDYRIVPMNEADVLGDPESGRTERCVAWHKFHNQLFYEFGVEPHRRIISTSRGYNEMRPWDDTVELHGVNSPQTLQYVIDHFGKVNIFPNGDGPDQNAQGRVGDRPNKREPSVAQAIEMARILKANGMKMYAYFQRPWDTGKRPGTDTDQDYYDALRALCGELAK